MNPDEVELTYIILEAPSVDELQVRVSSYLSLGWSVSGALFTYGYVPGHGPVQSAPSHWIYVMFCQVIIKDRICSECPSKGE